MDPSKPLEPMLTTEDVANFLKVDVVTVRRLVSRGELGAYRVGGEYRFAPDDLREYLRRQHVPPRDIGAMRGDWLRGIWFEGMIGALQRSRGRPPAGAEKPGERFTERARNALRLTQEAAMQRGVAEIDTGHLLLGLLREGGGVAARALKDLGLTTERAEAAVPGAAAPGPAAEQTLASEVKRALEAAVQESRRLKNDYVGTEHLLLGLLRHPDSQAGRLLAQLQVNTDALKTRVLELARKAP
jgi:excisionase family DNA binding protein